MRLGVGLNMNLWVRPRVRLGAAREPAATEGDASSCRTIVVVFQRSDLVLESGVRLIVRSVGWAVMRRIVRLRVVLEVWLRVILEVRLRVRLIMGL